MELGDDLSDAPDQDAQDEESQDGEAEGSDEGEGEGEDQSPQSATLDDSEKSRTPRGPETAESTLTETEDDDSAEPSDEELDTGDGERPARPDLKDGGRPEPAYKIYTTHHDEVISAEELCDAEELTRLRAYLDQQLAHRSPNVVLARLANRLQRQRPCWRSRTAPGPSTSRRECSTSPG